MIFYDIFVFFYFIHKKYLIIKFFFIENVPINYPSLSKNRAKLSKNRAKLSKSYPLFLNWYEKIRKKSKKSDFFTFLLMVSSPFL